MFLFEEFRVAFKDICDEFHRIVNVIFEARKSELGYRPQVLQLFGYFLELGMCVEYPALEFVSVSFSKSN